MACLSQEPLIPEKCNFLLSTFGGSRKCKKSAQYQLSPNVYPRFIHGLSRAARQSAGRQRGSADRQRGSADRQRGSADRQRGSVDLFERSSLSLSHLKSFLHYVASSSRLSTWHFHGDILAVVRRLLAALKCSERGSNKNELPIHFNAFSQGVPTVPTDRRAETSPKPRHAEPSARSAFWMTNVILEAPLRML